MMIGEIGGSAEEEAGRVHQGQDEQARLRVHRGGHRAAGKKMGHAGAIVSGGKGTAAAKMKRCAMRAPRSASTPPSAAS